MTLECSSKCIVLFLRITSLCLEAMRLIFLLYVFVEIYIWREHGGFASVELERTSLKVAVTATMVEATSVS